MTPFQVRREADALTRKYDTRLAIYKLRPAANEYCDQWQGLVDKEEPPSAPQRLFNTLLGKDSLRRKFPAVFEYLESCWQLRRLPHPNEILRPLVPESAASGLVPRELSPVTY